MRVDGRDPQPRQLTERLDGRLLRHRGLERAAPEPEASSSVTRAPRSATRSAPVIPQSTTPSWTYSGMSAARTSSTSTGAFRQGKASALAGLLGPEAGVLEQRDRRLAQAALRGNRSSGCRGEGSRRSSAVR